MDGEHGFGPAHGGILEHGVQIHRYQRGLPVVAVDDVGNPVQEVQSRQSSLAEEAVFGDVVHQADVGVAAGEELLVVDEVIDNAVADVLHDAYIVVAAGLAQIHVELAPVYHLVLVFLRDAGVAWQDHPDVAVLFDQLTGKGVHHVAQTAGFHERMAFRSDKSNTSAGRIIVRFHSNFLLWLNRFFCDGLRLFCHGGRCGLLGSGLGLLGSGLGLFGSGLGLVSGCRLFFCSRSSFCFCGLPLGGLRFFLCHNNSSFQIVLRQCPKAVKRRKGSSPSSLPRGWRAGGMAAIASRSPGPMRKH